MRYLIGIFATIGLIILILILLLRGGGNSTPQGKSLKLSDYAKTGSSAHFTIDGPVTADQKHQQARIDVEADKVTFTLYRGYEGDVVRQNTYTNNQEAYTTFLKALQTQGFTKLNAETALKDERGYCPLGQRHIYAFDDGSKQVLRSWSTSCGSGTFKGKIGTVSSLFEHQVPDYGTLVSDSDFNSF